MQPAVISFFDPATYTYSYVVRDPDSQSCIILDSVLDYDPASGRTTTSGADKIISYVREQQLSVDWLLETHVHADHLSAAPYLKEQLGGQLAIGAQITTVQQVFAEIFNAGAQFATDGSQFDRLLSEGDTLSFGKLGLVMRCLWVTPYLCRIMVLHVVISLAVMHIPCISLFSVCLSYRVTPECFCVTIIRPQTVKSIAMKALLQSSVRAIFTCVKASLQRSL